MTLRDRIDLVNNTCDALTRGLNPNAKIVLLEWAIRKLQKKVDVWKCYQGTNR